MANNSSPYAFSQDGKYLAFAYGDGLKIWETANGKSVGPHKKIAVCSCLKWSHGHHSHSPHTPRKKRRRKSVEAAVSDLGLLAVGSTNGSIYLWSMAKGEMHTQLEKGHTDEVTDISWHPNGTTLYSSSLDGHIVEWDVPSSQLKQKWKASSSGVHSLCLCGPNRLLTADRAIKMWDLTSRTVIQKFTGHSTEVFRLLPVLQQSSGGDDRDGSEASTCSYFLSAAASDKVVNAWMCHPDSSEKNAITSFSLTEEPAELSLHMSSDQMLTLCILTTKGKMLIFEHMLNGKLQKPLKPKTVIHGTTEGSREEVSMPVPILGSVPKAASANNVNLLMALGSVLRPRFESVSLKPSQPEIVVVVATPERQQRKTEFSMVKNPDVGGSAVLYPSQTAAMGPNTEPGQSRRKRKRSVSELTVVERLEAMGVDKPGEASGSSSGSKPPKADQLVVQLTQGLQSGDAKLLTNAFQEKNDATIVKTVERLPIHMMQPLTKEIVQRMHGHPQSAALLGNWIKHILRIHMAYLTTIPDIATTLVDLNQYIQYRQQAAPKLVAAKGKIHLLLSRIATQSQVDEHDTSAEPVLMYQDESDEEALPVELGTSESEDHWEDSDTE